MDQRERKEIVRQLLERYGITYAEELGVHVEQGTPSALFQLLTGALMFSARISAEAAVKAHKALRKAGWTTPQKMSRSTWAQRTRVLNENGYARYDEKTSAMLGEAAQKVLHDYRGDLRRLREQAGHDPQQERRLLTEFKGIGDVGADIFFREAQEIWDELYPFTDQRALRAAERLGLPAEPEALAELVPREDWPRLADALVRTELAKDHGTMRAAALGR
jgi:endonuclease III